MTMNMLTSSHDYSWENEKNCPVLKFLLSMLSVKSLCCTRGSQ